MGASAVVVNHRVALPGSAARRAVGGSRLLYISSRPGAVREATDDDLRMGDESELMARLGYIAYRPGAVAGIGAGHALFDQTGVPDRAAVAREISEAEGAVITSIASARREEAEALGLADRRGWERLLRARWADTVAEMGVMERQDVRWCAACHYHPAGINIHVHIFTWDASGNFDGLLPKRRMVEADEGLVSFALGPRREELDLARTQARDELAARLRSAELPDDAAVALLSSLPAEGSLKYAALAKRAPEAARAADRCASAALEADPGLREAHGAWREAVIGHARLRSLSGAALETYVAAAESDLRTRLGNAVIENVRRRAPEPAQAHAPRRKARADDELRAPARDEAERRVLRPRRLSEASGYASGPTLREEMRERALAEEASSFLGTAERRRLAGTLARGEAPDAALLGAIPSVRATAAREGASLSAVAERVGEAARGIEGLAEASLGGGRPDAGGEAAREALAALGRALRVGLASLAKRPARPLSEKDAASLKAAERTVIG